MLGSPQTRDDGIWAKQTGASFAAFVNTLVRVKEVRSSPTEAFIGAMSWLPIILLAASMLFQ